MCSLPTLGSLPTSIQYDSRKRAVDVFVVAKPTSDSGFDGWIREHSCDER